MGFGNPFRKHISEMGFGNVGGKPREAFIGADMVLESAKKPVVLLDTTG